jgi:serine phosphatase RsbU (regulator of sigma subunit)
LALGDGELLRQLASELKNFEEIAAQLLPQPGEVPRLAGIDVWGGTRPLNGQVGGDHIIYIDFKRRFDLEARIAEEAALGRSAVVDNLRRCQRMAGIALVDASGHRVTDALLAAMLHQAFLLGAIYELDRFGQITKRLFENLNSRFYQSSGAHKYLSLLYGEISEDARFRFLSAAHPFPAVFSAAHDRFMDVSQDACVSCPPLGMLPSLDAIDRNVTAIGGLGFKEKYAMNEWQLMGAGDILLLHTDGFSEHAKENAYFPGRVEDALREVKGESARVIFEALMTHLNAFEAPSDDISLVVIKRTA